MIWENGKLLSTSPSPQHDKTKDPEILIQFKIYPFEAHRWLLSGHPGSSACSQLLSTSSSLLESACGAYSATGHARAARLSKGTSKCITRWWVGREKERERETSSCRSWVMWMLRSHDPWRKQVSASWECRSPASKP